MRPVSDQTVSDPASQLYNQGLNTRKAVLSLAAFASPPCTHSFVPSPLGTGLVLRHSACPSLAPLPASAAPLRTGTALVLQAKGATLGEGFGMPGEARQCLPFGTGRCKSRSPAVQNPELPLTENTKQYKQQEQNLHQKSPALSDEIGDAG